MIEYDRLIKVGSISGIISIEVDHDIGVGVLIYEQSGTRTLLAMAQEMVRPFTTALRDAMAISSRERRKRDGH
jgi:hypothetical protein